MPGIDRHAGTAAIVASAVDFDAWRAKARELLKAGVHPASVTWRDGSDVCDDLFADTAGAPQPAVRNAPAPRIARAHLQTLQRAARYRPQGHELGRWPLLYQALWRLSRGDDTALNAADETGAEVQRRVHAVKREAHHMHAFLRFHHDVETQDGSFIAWFEPAHDVLDLGAEHFADRLGSACFRIATPQGGVEWDGQRFVYHATCPVEWHARALAAATADDDRTLWRTYFVSTFNPARLNHKVMTQHMPQRFWRHLSEGDLIPALEAKARHGGQRLAQEASVGQRKGKALPPDRTRTNAATTECSARSDDASSQSVESRREDVDSPRRSPI